MVRKITKPPKHLFAILVVYVATPLAFKHMFMRGNGVDHSTRYRNLLF